jgi:hypothetical protein
MTRASSVLLDQVRVDATRKVILFSFTPAFRQVTETHRDTETV